MSDPQAESKQAPDPLAQWRELRDAYINVARQFGLELVCGVYEHSHWMSDLLVIVSNQGRFMRLKLLFTLF